MAGFGAFLALILNLFTLALLGRLVLDYVRIFSPSWRPSGIILWLASTVYAVTDPPVNFVRRFVPPLRLGGVALDLSFIVVLIAVIQATVARAESSDLLAVLDELHAHAFTNGGVRLFGFDTNLFNHDSFHVGRSPKRVTFDGFSQMCLVVVLVSPSIASAQV